MQFVEDLDAIRGTDLSEDAVIRAELREVLKRPGTDYFAVSTGVVPDAHTGAGYDEAVRFVGNILQELVQSGRLTPKPNRILSIAGRVHMIYVIPAGTEQEKIALARRRIVERAEEALARFLDEAENVSIAPEENEALTRVRKARFQ